MILRHGRVVSETFWEPYRADENHLLYSLTKSFASTAVGFAVHEGFFGLDDLLVDLFPEQTPETVSENLAMMTVRHLLTMSTGHETEPAIYPSESTWEVAASHFLAHPVLCRPGTHFLYNTPASNMLSVLVQKFSGETLDVFLSKRLLAPLGIFNVQWTWGKNFVWGGSGLHATTESIAKLGLVYLNGGRWDEEQLLPVGWADLATSKQVDNGDEPDNDWHQGYGFQFWRCRHGAFRGDGAFGQFCIVLPQFDAVVAITTGESNMQKVLDTIWSILLPAFDDAETSDLKLPVSRSLPPLASVSEHPTSLVISCPSFQCNLAGDGGEIQYLGPVPFSLSEWKKFSYSFGRDTKVEAWSKGGWVSATTLEVAVWNAHTPQAHHFWVETSGTIRFKESGMFSPFPEEQIFCEIS